MLARRTRPREAVRGLVPLGPVLEIEAIDVFNLVSTRASERVELRNKASMKTKSDGEKFQVRIDVNPKHLRKQKLNIRVSKKHQIFNVCFEEIAFCSLTRNLLKKGWNGVIS